MIVENLRQFGLNEKEIAVYLSLVALGPSPARLVAQKAQVNRGTCYDILKQLIGLGLVATYDHYHAEDKRQYFAAEPPQKLLSAIDNKKRDLETLKEQMGKSLPELEVMYEKSGTKPVVKYYEGNQGIKTILQDVLTTLSPSPGVGRVGERSNPIYYVYSSADIRKYLYKAYPNFNADRLKHNICVKAIALGSGGELVGLDERKWLSPAEDSPSYILIYSGKQAMISIDPTGLPVGVIIEDEHLYQTQKIIFQKLWETL